MGIQARRVIGCFIFCCGVLSCEGRTLFIAPNGDDLSAVPDDSSHPYGTLECAFRALQNGDRLEVQAGNYQIQPNYPSPIYPEPSPGTPMPLMNLTNVVVIGNGQVDIFGPGPGDFISVTDCRNIRVENLTLRSDRTGIPETDPPNFANPTFSTIMLRGRNEGLHFEDLRILSFGNHGISHLHGQKTSFNVVVTNCYFADGGDGNYSLLDEDGAAVSGVSSGARIENNVVERCFRGLEVEGAWGAPITNVVIEGNLLTNCHTIGIMLFATTHTEEYHRLYGDIRIRNNRIVNMAAHPDLAKYPAVRTMFGILLQGGDDMEVTGNHIEGIPGGLGISLNSQRMAMKNVLVASNTVLNTRFRGIQVYQFGTNVLEEVRVNNNRISEAVEAGILLNGSRIECTGNVVENSASFNEIAAIKLMHDYLGSESAIICDNVITNRNDGYGDYGIWIQSGARNSTLFGNRFYSVPLGAIRDEGVGTAILPKIQTLQRNDSNVSVSAFGLPGLRYRLEVSHDLASWRKVDEQACSENGMFDLSYVPDPPRVSPAGTILRIVSAVEPAPAFE
jgi:hypothetical protein